LKIFKQLPELRTESGFTRYRKILKEYDSLLDYPSNKIQFLTQPEVMDICKSSIHYYNGKIYNILCYCIMPNHIHLVFELLNSTKSVGDIMGSIKKYSAAKSNKILNRGGHFWQAESFDRLVRDDVELYFTIKYVLLNPVNAGLTEQWGSWRGTYCPIEYQVIDQ
jgi:REP element-mobilizing transposase RayT